MSAAQGAEYAMLVAGPNGFYNYHHQAEVGHSYQVVRSKGIPATNIIVMAYDDIAGSGPNPSLGSSTTSHQLQELKAWMSMSMMGATLIIPVLM